MADARGRGVYAGWPNQNRAIFIHVPKTAGTSVSKALGVPTSRHVRAEDYRMSNPVKFARFFKFAFVRNPYDRLLSSYSFLKAGGMNDDDAEFADRHIRTYQSFEHFVMEGLAFSTEIQKWIHFWPQSKLVCDSAGRNLLDFTGRFESLSEDYSKVAERLGKPNKLPFTNSSQRSDYRVAYSSKMIDAVRHIYAADFESFGYKFD